MTDENEVPLGGWAGDRAPSVFSALALISLRRPDDRLPLARALDPGIKTWIRDRPVPVSTAPGLCLHGTYTCGQRAPGRLRDTVCEHGMGSPVGVDAVSLSLLLWAQGVLVPWEEGP